MENIEDFIESEDDEEQDSSTKDGVTKVKAGKELLGLFSKNQEKSKPETDKTPELDAEAPVEHLSQVEETAISQTLAEERLAVVQDAPPEELSSEHVAAVNYLEAVISSGDIDQEYLSVAEELGDSPDDAEEDLRTVGQPSWAENQKTAVDMSEKTRPPTTEAKETKKPADTKNETAGLVYYLMSRRKARLKSESSAPTVESSLAKEVNHLRTKLATREQQIRRVAAEESKPIGRPLDGKEAFSSPSPEQSPARPKEIMEPVSAEIQAKTIPRAELLKQAAEIEVEGTKLSAIYENNLLGERGLRRVVAEYLRGGNVKKALRREMIEREIDFERDPNLRDRGDHFSVTPPPTTLDSLLQKTGIDWSNNQQTLLPERPKKKFKLASLAPSKKQRSIRAGDVVLVVIIVILLVVLLVVVFNR